MRGMHRGVALPASQPRQSTPMAGRGSRLLAALRHAARTTAPRDVAVTAAAPGAMATACVRTSVAAAALGSSGCSARLCMQPSPPAVSCTSSRSTAAESEVQRGMRTIAAARRKAAAADLGTGGGSDANTAAAEPAAAETAPKKRRGRPKKASTAAAAPADTPAERDPLSAAAGAAASNAPDIANSTANSISAPTARTQRGNKAAQKAAAADAADTAPAASGGTAKRKADQPQLPPPDLGACMPADPKPWAAVERWVVFSDLHVSPRTAAVAVEVLQRVHAEAEARDAGVLFLGECRYISHLMVSKMLHHFGLYTPPPTVAYISLVSYQALL